VSLLKSKKERKNIVRSLKPFVYLEEIPFDEEVWHKIQDRIKIWSDSKNPVEWACLLISKPRVEKDKAIAPIVDFIELPLWEISRNRGLNFLIDDVARIAKEKFVVGLLHSHPSGDLTPSSSDWATFLYLDSILGRPLLYIIMSPHKPKPLVIHFERCHKCPYSFLNLLKEIKKGGEKEWRT